MMNETSQNTEQRPTTPTPEAEGGQGGEKMFTQADLDRIIGERLSRARRDADTDKREAALIARESRLTCREYLSNSNLPAELADILPTDNVEIFKANVAKLSGLFRQMEPIGNTMRVHLTAPLSSSPGSNGDKIADAFKPPKI